MIASIESNTYLQKIQQFTLLCISSIWLPFIIQDRVVSISHTNLASYIALFLPVWNIPNVRVVHSVEVQLFFESCAELEFILGDLNLNQITPVQASLFNDLVLCIRRMYRHPIYIKLIEDRNMLNASQKAIYKEYVSGLFRSFS